MLRRRRIQQYSIYLEKDNLRKKKIDLGLAVRFNYIIDVNCRFSLRFHREGKIGFPDRRLGCRGFEMIVDELNFIVRAIDKSVGKHLPDSCSTGIVRLRAQVRIILRRRISFLFHRFGHLPSYGVYGDLHAFFPVFVNYFTGFPYDIGIESSAKRAVGTEAYESDFPDFGLGSSEHTLGISASHQIAKDTAETLLVRDHVSDGVLRLAELGGGHHLHR